MLADDFERTVVEGQQFTKNAPQKTSKTLTILPYKLYLKSHKPYQITYNKKHQFANSQLAVLFDMPSDERLHAKSTIELVVAPVPPGVI